MNKKYNLSFFVVVSITVAFSLLCSCKNIDIRSMKGESEKEPDKPIGALLFEGDKPGARSRSPLSRSYLEERSGPPREESKGICTNSNENRPVNGYTKEHAVQHLAKLLRSVVAVLLESYINNEATNLLTCGSAFPFCVVVKKDGIETEKPWILTCAHIFTRHEYGNKIFATKLTIKPSYRCHQDLNIDVLSGGLEPVVTQKELQKAIENENNYGCEEPHIQQEFSISRTGKNEIEVSALPGNESDIYGAGYSSLCDRCDKKIKQICDMVFLNPGKRWRGPLPCKLSPNDVAWSDGANLMCLDGSIFKEEDLISAEAMVLLLRADGEDSLSETGDLYTSDAESFIIAGRLMKLEYRVYEEGEEHAGNSYTKAHYAVKTAAGFSGSPLFLVFRDPNSPGGIKILTIGIHLSGDKQESGTGLVFTPSVFEKMFRDTPEFKEYKAREALRKEQAKIEYLAKGFNIAWRMINLGSSALVVKIYLLRLLGKIG